MKLFTGPAYSGKTDLVLGRITKAGDPYLRMLLILGARSVLQSAKDKGDSVSRWAVQLAARLCAAAAPGDVTVSVAVRELCTGKPFRFEDRGRVTLKGLPEPAQIYTVLWRQESE